MSNPIALPTGTSTFFFTDIKGSTRIWEKHPEAIQAALASHDCLLRESIEAFGGYVFKTVGDAFCAAFCTAFCTAHAALDAPWPSSAPCWTNTVAKRPSGCGQPCKPVTPS